VINQENPNREQVSLFLNRLEILTDEEKEKLQRNISKLILDSAWKSKMANAWHLAGYAARDSARNLAWVSARDSARNLAWVSARDSARSLGEKSLLFPSREAARTSGALVVRDLIAGKDFEILIAPFRFLLEELGIVDRQAEQKII
jgi:hypothetical protein